MRPTYIFLQSLFFLLLLGSIAWVPVGKPRHKNYWAVSSSSSLQVKGSTNLNKFSCEISSYDRLDTLEVTKNKDAVGLSGRLRLNLKSFDCHHPIMTKDLRKTLKTDQFPHLSITFLSLNKLPTLSQKPTPITGWVDIDLAGTRKRVEVKYQISVDAQNVVHLVGLREVNFSDFNLVPPTKMKGMVKTHQKLAISFHLKMKPLENFI
ncbi:YceI family protein [Nibribacter koreensis]|uniref:Lipid/polyisoprenoid-binding YceI-like domain-containing protein n=1 Tax=Nibribacter koreensis TaxID=1084519 RepID=A0ABP8FI80_9BACT